MTSFRWYLVDALIRWLLDNDCIPHVVIQCDLAGVSVPQEYVQNNQLVLNVSPSAVHNFVLNADRIEFDTRFNGVSHRICAPPGAIVGVHARGSNEGMSFEPEIQEAIEPRSDTNNPAKPQESEHETSHLRFVD